MQTGSAIANQVIYALKMTIYDLALFKAIDDQRTNVGGATNGRRVSQRFGCFLDGSNQ